MSFTSTPQMEKPLPCIDNQDASPFFKLPFELRRAVYAQAFDLSACHLYSSASNSDGTPRLRLASCVSPAASHERDLDGSERCPVKRTPDLYKWPLPSLIFKRRSRSSWGPHWMCEELVLHAQDLGEDLREKRSALRSRAFSPTLRVCKRWCLDLIGEVTTTADFHVADLRTLESLLETAGLPVTEFGLGALNCARINSLAITLSQPLAFFEAIEKFCSTDTSSSFDSEHESDIAFWTRLPSILPARLPCLRKLQIWLDHIGSEYWSVVNEREILGPLEAVATSKSALELVWILPKVHPSIEDRQRHYLPGDEEQQGQSSSRLEIQRSLRQRYRVFKKDRTGEEYMDSIQLDGAVE
ncbi:hypothetical protein B0T16DRAFT_492379 [Cercophora newfieldiana]|uniref:DUF7730 domain-containing protein n=1 Tax=Cercophora newfieldiana TaxID=92897 RepID=A0AA39YC01_9PEZI|nr:hypothetical protein B0T16DRAFT_492379 [Cercophora newfieldiana]